MVDTRSIPEFPHESQKGLYSLRREFTSKVKFPFDPEMEEVYISALSDEKASTALDKLRTEFEAYTKKASKSRTKKPHGKVTTPPATRPAGGPRAHTAMGPTNGDGVTETTPANEPASNENSMHGSDSDDGDDPRRQTSKKDRQTVRGRSPRIDTGTKAKKKLFKMNPPAKYTGEKAADRTYEAVHQFLSQLSRYLRLATHVDMERDISEYVLGFLDGFAYRWFEALDKGDKPFRWKEFESVFRAKFIPRDHVQISLRKYLAIKQNGRPVSEFIVERESLENTLGVAISDELKESSFHDNLDEDLVETLVAFCDLPYEQFKRKAESTDQEMRERNLGPYAVEKTSSDGIHDKILEEWNGHEGTESATGAQGAQEGLDNVGKEDVAFFSPRENVGCTDKTLLEINAGNGNCNNAK